MDVNDICFMNKQLHSYPSYKKTYTDAPCAIMTTMDFLLISSNYWIFC